MNKVLEATGVSKAFGDKKVLENVNISLNKGEIVSLLGVSGVGKTTLFHILSGLSCPDEGKVFFNGEKDITGVPGSVSYMLQKDLLLPYKKVADNVAMPLILNGMKRKDAVAKVNDLFDEFGIEGTQGMYPVELSGGMRQRAALLRTYVASKGVALLDEPFSALDTITKKMIHKWFLDVMGKIDLSVFFITHDIDEAITLSDRIYVLGGSPGQVVKEIDLGGKKKKEFELTPEFLEVKKEVIEALKI